MIPLPPEWYAFRSPEPQDYQAVGLVSGRLHRLSHDWYEVQELPFHANSFPEDTHPTEYIGRIIQLVYWPNEEGLPHKVKEVLTTRLPQLRHPYMLIRGYISPTTKKLVVPFREARSGPYRYIFPIPAAPTELPIIPGRKYDVVAAYNARRRAWTYQLEAPIIGDISTLPPIRDDAIDIDPFAITLTHHRHRLYNPSDRFIEKIRRFVATYQTLFSPVEIYEYKPGQYTLVKGLKRLLIAQEFGLKEIPAIVVDQPFLDDLCIPPLDIMYEDDHVVVFLKPAGFAAHPNYLHNTQCSIADMLAVSVSPLSTGYDNDRIEFFRPGMVHRLDRDTSGVMVACKTQEAHECLSEQFREHSIQREYQAIVWGKSLPESGRFDTYHGKDEDAVDPRGWGRTKYTSAYKANRRAITYYDTEVRYPNGFALVRCRLETGKTHQIRMHLSEADAPLLGDNLYGDERTDCVWMKRQALHAYILGFQHPEGDMLHFEAPPPKDFLNAMVHCEAGRSVKR